MAGWQEFPWSGDDGEPLCVDGRDPIRIDCRIEGADFGETESAPRDDLVICAYNAERGLRLAGQLAAFSSGATGMPAPDLLLLSEADRGCSRSGGVNVAREYARALGMRYVYGVEFVELPRFWGPGGGRIRRACEHGNAILSRCPLGNVRVLRHRRVRSWHSRVQRTLRLGQPRLGGRVAVAADVRAGRHVLRVYSVHLESGRRGAAHRLAQVAELINDAGAWPHRVVIGGDMNVLGYVQADGNRSPPDGLIAALATAGYRDAHIGLAPGERVTTDDGQTIDLIVGRNVRFTGAGVGPPSVWGGLSDHLPVWARIDLGAGDA